MRKQSLLNVLDREAAFPVIVLAVSGISLTTMWLAGYASETTPAHHFPLRLFLFSMCGLALRDLLRIHRARQD